MLMIEAIELTKSFGAVQAVRGVNFSVKRGEVVGFLGPNGAGKSTTFRMIAGTLGASSGSVKLQGIELSSNPLSAKRLLGYMPENAPLYPELTGEEYLTYRSELKSIPRALRKDAVAHAASQAGSAPLLGTLIAHLSKGYRQRLALADALLGNPPILLLDEPTSGLDPNQVLEMRELVLSLAKDHAILLSTHVLSEVEATCSRAIVIHEGRVIAEGSLDELRSHQELSNARLVLKAPPEKVEDALMSLGRVNFSIKENPEESTSTVTLHLRNEVTISSAISLCCEKDIPVLEATPILAALNEVFAHLTTTEVRT